MSDQRFESRGPQPDVGEIVLKLAAAVLPRAEWDLACEAVRERFQNSVVLVTGAAGSVGASLVECLLDLGCRRVVAVDAHEPSLFRLRQRVASVGGSARTRFALGDVRDTGRMRRLVLGESPSIVLHLAAYKHVPIGEENVDQVVGVNIVGTARLLAICAEAGVSDFVYPSTDKAVNPPSIYGATKRVVERYLLAVERQAGPRCKAVRLINVVGTQGSVVETFARQVLEGRALGVTDLRMTRYWMTMREATGIVAWAAASTERRLFIVDAGDAIPVAETARRVSAALRPGEEPRIVEIGIRQGERLHEQLLYDYEAAPPTSLPGVLEIRHGLGGVDVGDLTAANVEALERALYRASDDVLRAATFAAARGEDAEPILSAGSSEYRR